MYDLLIRIMVIESSKAMVKESIVKLWGIERIFFFLHLNDSIHVQINSYKYI